MCLCSDQPSLQILWIFCAKTDLMLENLWRMFENLNLGKLSLKLVFLKNFASHTHAFYSFFSLLGGIYAKTGLFFLKLCFFWNFDWLRLFFRSIEIFSKFLSEPLFVSINRKSCGMFYKQFFKWVKHFFKKFSPFSLSIRLGQGKSSFFCRFRSIFLLGFPLFKPVSPFTLLFAFYFMFACINSCISLGFSELFKLGFLMIQTTFSEIDHWVLFL